MRNVKLEDVAGAVLAALALQGCSSNDNGNASNDASVPPIVVDGGGLPTSCLSPCHGFKGIVEQWRTSVHYSAYVSNLGGQEAESWTGTNQPCGNCHAVDGLEQRTAGNVLTTGDGGIAAATSGLLEYKNAKGVLSEGAYGGNAKVAEVHCTTCHAVTAEDDPHRTGQPYSPGAFPLRVPTGTGDQALLEKSPAPGDVTGTPAGALGNANTCVWCHKSRKDVTNYIGASNAITSPFWGPHEGPQSDVFSGVGAYQFAGMKYDESTHHQKLTCNDCHMPPAPDNGNMANHSFYAQVSACRNCHAGARDFDVAGGQTQVKAALSELEAALNAVGYLTRNEAAPYGPLTDDQLADQQFSLDRARPGAGMPGGGGGADAGADGGDGGTSMPTATATLTADQAGALYNYFIMSRGAAFGVHNPIYVKQVIWDSMVAITGHGAASLGTGRP